jgi:hypothetical protein
MAETIGLHVGSGGRKNHSAALVFATFFRAESDQNSSHPCVLPFSVDSGAGVKIAMSSLLPTQTAHHFCIAALSEQFCSDCSSQ